MNRSNPFDEIEQFFGRTPFAGAGRDLRSADVDVAEYDDEVVVMADLPGFDREDIDVRADDGRITIRAERDAERADDSTPDTVENGRYLRRERRHESVTRSVDLRHDLVEADATATYHNGVLTVTLPKRTPEDGDDSHRIDVE
ncbi:HSP20 family protein [Halorubrum alkaliphilum]|uniref:HSP20 family protein n=1 Tax=Halorubrum alkaliphilum TaxID=261290 RepID=A0A8T4GGV2_9EURY|nr:Hsp20/alpha crystallin family protein [Halorubrum alkaliphilum]MBP1923383.1 HSP20 family protein [Halorubrum alkaliphilum]